MIERVTQATGGVNPRMLMWPAAALEELQRSRVEDFEDLPEFHSLALSHR